MSIMNTSPEFTAALMAYLNHIGQNYVTHVNATSVDETTPDGAITAQIRKEMSEKFLKEITFEVGRKYIRVVAGNSAHSFIVFKDGGKFSVGSILAAASWAAPATNFSRGNILTGNYRRVSWTGATASWGA